MSASSAPPPDEATQRQIAAADPRRSTWVAANAGSGKTRVLTERVARLLLDGAQPQDILCLTYTKAAAGEMQNRLFGTLGGWSMAASDKLRDGLRVLGVTGDLDEARLDDARRLFAAAIETPGGLKIQTIHAFCASILRRFPLEAGVSPQFAELDPRSLAMLIDEVVEALADGPQADRVDALALYLSGDDSLHGLVAQIMKSRDLFERPMTATEALRLHGLPDDFDRAALLAEVFTGGEDVLLSELVAVLAAGSVTDVKAAERLESLRPFAPEMGLLSALESLLLFGGGAAAPFGAKIGKFPTKGSQANMDPGDLEDLNALMERVEAARPRRLALDSAARTLALHRFAEVFLPEVARRKSRGGWLDFDDLILRTRDLLSDRAVADWVLYKLDGGIAHILVDEAQDTSPEQWQVIRLLTRDMGSGSGGHGVETLFVVGDEKQSIYSFQGADPDLLAPLRTEFDDRLRLSGAGLSEGVLEHSFRSAPGILQAVDAVFADPFADATGAGPRHQAFFAERPGRVDLWPPEPKAAKDPDQPWTDPTDRRSDRHEKAVLADRIAAWVAGLLRDGTVLPDGKGGTKTLDAGDVLILVQRRGAIFNEILRACKQEFVPVAGADRLVVTAELAVRDLLAVLSFLSLQEDDLALAEALRSPLFGWSDGDLYRIAQPRRGTLWQALRGDAASAATLAVLRDLRDKADFLRPYDLLERILIHHKGRERLLARLGPDCEEAVDALLDLALDYESAEVPSLTGFLEWMRAEDVEIKRQAEGSAGLLRLMTVHGAKGLESPLVILPDTADRRAAQPADILQDTQGRALWKTSSDAAPEVLRDAMAEAKARLARERLRLLYVAMTRAEQWLVVCAAGEAKAEAEAWHALVEDGLRRLGAAPLTCPDGGAGLRYETGDWTVPALPVGNRTTPPTRPALPAWALSAAEPPLPVVAGIAPSQLGGAKALPGDPGQTQEAAIRRGTLLHLLLEHLPSWPEASWREFGPALLTEAEDRPDPEEAEELLAEATAVLTNPDLRFLFAEDSLAEVDISAALSARPDLPRLRGSIDRLILSPERVLAVDYKSNVLIPATAADTPEGLLRQMGAYAAALADVFPDRRIETAILWTRTARLMPLPALLTSAALARATV
jgi:ATP-dependent helicase/nuclease subunit A